MPGTKDFVWWVNKWRVTRSSYVRIYIESPDKSIRRSSGSKDHVINRFTNHDTCSPILLLFSRAHTCDTHTIEITTAALKKAMVKKDVKSKVAAKKWL